LKGHSDWVRCVSFASAKDKHILSGSADGTIICWEVETGNKIHSFSSSSSSYVYGISSFLHNKDFFASVYSNRQLTIWSIANKQQVLSIDTSACCACLAIRNDEKHIATGHQNPNEIMIWELELNNNNNNNNIRKREVLLNHHSGLVLSVAYSKDDKYLASGSCDNTINIYSVINNYALVKRLKGFHKDWINSVAFVGNSHSLISTGKDRTIRIFDQESITTIKSGAVPVNSAVFANASYNVNEDGFIVDCRDDKTIQVIMNHELDRHVDNEVFEW